jgi:nicotinamidase-related amidase
MLAFERRAFDAQFHAHTLPAAQRALAAARRGGLEVIYTLIANLTDEGHELFVAIRLHSARPPAAHHRHPLLRAGHCGSVQVARLAPEGSECCA